VTNFIGGETAIDWILCPSLSVNTYQRDLSIDLTIFSLHVAGISSILEAEFYFYNSKYTAWRLSVLIIILLTTPRSTRNYYFLRSKFQHYIFWPLRRGRSYFISIFILIFQPWSLYSIITTQIITHVDYSFQLRRTLNTFQIFPRAAHLDDSKKSG